MNFLQRKGDLHECKWVAYFGSFEMQGGFFSLVFALFFLIFFFFLWNEVHSSLSDLKAGLTHKHCQEGPSAHPPPVWLPGWHSQESLVRLQTELGNHSAGALTKPSRVMCLSCDICRKWTHLENSPQIPERNSFNISDQLNVACKVSHLVEIPKWSQRKPLWEC